MDPFELPAELPTDSAGLAELRTAAGEYFQGFKDKVAKGEDLTEDELAALRGVVAAIDTLKAAQVEASSADQARADEIAALLTDETDEAVETEAEETAEVTADEAAEVVAEAEAAAADAAESVTAGATGAKRAVVAKTKFSGLAKGAKPPALQKRADVGWRMEPNTFGYKGPDRVGFREIAEAVDSVRPGSRARSNRGAKNGFSAQTLARLDRTLEVIDDSHDLVAAIEEATKASNLLDPSFDDRGSLTAAGGWCAPSETLYDFCDVPVAVDLVSLPEITINRGGVRWPNEPDLSAIFDSFQFFFTEPELEDVDGEGVPTAFKDCVEVPCPDTFTELRLNAVGYCVNAGILQDQGWPELIAWFLQNLTAEHFRAISRRTILDMVAGSGSPIVIAADSQIAAGSALLNSLALMAVNLRLNKGLGRTAVIEGVAPSWLHEVIRADLANQVGVDTKAVTDSQIDAWFSVRNIRLQFVADWQTRDTDKPGNLATLLYPNTVDILLYPAGTWFRAMSNVIELGTMYPKEQLQINRYTRFFTEDAIAVGKRCNTSILVRVPICPSGAIGARQTISCNTPATQVNEVQQVAITGTPTGGTFTLTFDGLTTGAIAYNASAAAVKTALAALANLDAADLVTSGGALPGTPVVVSFQGAVAGVNLPQMTADPALLTGGTSPAVVVTTVTQGHS